MLLMEKLGVVGPLLTVGGCVRGGVYREIVSQPLLPGSMWVSSLSPHV